MVFIVVTSEYYSLCRLALSHSRLSRVRQARKQSHCTFSSSSPYSAVLLPVVQFCSLLCSSALYSAVLPLVPQFFPLFRSSAPCSSVLPPILQFCPLFCGCATSIQFCPLFCSSAPCSAVMPLVLYPVQGSTDSALAPRLQKISGAPEELV